MIKKILFVIPMYGKEVQGGGEWHCRQIAERLAKDYTVEVATTCAKSFVTWANEYDTKKENLNGVLIHRFPTDIERDKKFPEYRKDYKVDEFNTGKAIRWLTGQGPNSKELFK
ncbi:MAG: glycosyltransferase family 1 protein, partial [Ignavibacteriae bacterium]|nr:glycosyltransferase family 1 protein [Ignavibacteriota bacterium]